MKAEEMLLQRNFWVVLVLIGVVFGANLMVVKGLPRRILLDTDVDTDDLSALLYLLKLNRSEFELEAVTISTNAWTSAGHAVNQIYDILYMMDRDDVAVGVGGEGGILEDGTIQPNVGGYLSIIEQGLTTTGGCRYRQAIPVGVGGRLDADTNYGLRKAFLPQGSRRYNPLQQSTAQQVMIDKISEGPINIFLIGSHTNFAIFLMSNPHLKKNVEHIYIMGGGIRSENPTCCCTGNASQSCTPRQCGDPGNLFTDYNSNPYAEFNIFGDPFAAYQVIHSGIPVTIIPLDATDTIPLTKNFFEVFEQNQDTVEAQYIFQSLKIARDYRLGDQFYTNYFMWDSFASGVATSIMLNSHIGDGQNDFALMEYMNITVVTSNKPYGISDGSNPFFYGRQIPKFGLDKGGVHSGHAQTGLRDPFCIVNDGKGICQDGYTTEVMGPEGVRILVATRAKPNRNISSPLDREFYTGFLDVINSPINTGRFNFTTQFPYYEQVLYLPDFRNIRLGKPVVIDMDMSAGDFLALFYLLKVPVEVIDIKAIIASPTGWANAATIDVIYDLLHMMGRDDIPVGLGDVFAVNQSDSVLPTVGDCKYAKAIPNGCGGYLDSDTLYGLARNFPRSPRRYTAECPVKHEAPRNSQHPELRQPLAMDIWESILTTLEPGSKISVLTNGPLTNLAKLITSNKNASSLIQEVYIVGGHIKDDDTDKGNVFTVPSNIYAEFNIFLDPLGARTVFESTVNVTLVPLGIQRRVSSFENILGTLRKKNRTPELLFANRLLSRLFRLKQSNIRYEHVDTFLGEILGAVVLAEDLVKPVFQFKPVKILADGDESQDGQTVIYEKCGKLIQILQNLNQTAYIDLFANRLSDTKQSAVIKSFIDQKRIWYKLQNLTCNYCHGSCVN
ncbi:hypothetical protein IC582_012767 [Cucumis melo]